MINSQREKELKYISFLSSNVGAKFSREQNYLIMFSRDLAHNFGCINANGITKLADVAKKDWKDSIKQNYFDFVCTFENLCCKIKEFRWSVDKLAQNGIDFNSYQSLYIAIN